MTRVVDTIKVVELLEAEISGSILEHAQNELFVDPNKIFEIAALLKDHEALELGYLTSITAVDYIEYFQIVYHLYSTTHKHKLVLKISVPPEEPKVKSVISIWPSSDWFERESHDLFGVLFDGHPDMSPLLLYDGFEGYPGLKSFDFHDYTEW